MESLLREENLAMTVIRDYFLNEEPNFIEGERVVSAYNSSWVNEGDTATVIVEWHKTFFGVKCNCNFMGVVLDKNGQKIFGIDMDNRWKSLTL